MIKSIKLFIVFSLITCVISNSFSQSKEAVIKRIRNSFQQINSDRTLKTVKLENGDFLPDLADAGTSLTGYVKGDTIYKMNVWIGLSYCVRQYNYYFSNNRLIFIYESEKDFPEDSHGGLNYNKLNLAFEGRYYLDKGKIIDMKIKGKKRMEANPSAESVKSLLADAQSYKKLISAHLNKKNK